MLPRCNCSSNWVLFSQDAITVLSHKSLFLHASPLPCRRFLIIKVCTVHTKPVSGGCCAAAPAAERLLQAVCRGDGGVGPGVGAAGGRAVCSRQRHRHLLRLLRRAPVRAPQLQHARLQRQDGLVSIDHHSKLKVCTGCSSRKCVHDDLPLRHELTPRMVETDGEPPYKMTIDDA